MSSKYLNANGVRYTQVLFWEEWIQLDESRRVREPVFTLYNEKPGLTCFRTTFVEMGDPTGYLWAIQYLGDYDHYQKLLRCSWFQEALEVAQNELKQKTRATAIQTIRAIAQGENPAQALPAAKYLAEFGWEKAGRGRPSKQEITGELKKQVQLLEAEDEDWKRIKAVK